MTHKRIKILCLHGYRQNGVSFREKTGGFRKIIKKYADVEFIDAPNCIPPEDSTNISDAELGWWFVDKDKQYFDPLDSDIIDYGLDKSMKVLEAAWASHGPFGGVMGFSQGATMAGLMCSRLQQEGPACPFQFDFALLVAASGRRPTCDPDVYFTKKITIPTLHVMGDADVIIPKEMSESFLHHFKDPAVLTHPGGHFVPVSGPQKDVFRAFFERMVSASQDLQ